MSYEATYDIIALNQEYTYYADIVGKTLYDLPPVRCVEVFDIADSDGNVSNRMFLVYTDRELFERFRWACIEQYLSERNEWITVDDISRQLLGITASTIGDDVDIQEAWREACIIIVPEEGFFNTTSFTDACWDRYSRDFMYESYVSSYMSEIEDLLRWLDIELLLISPVAQTWRPQSHDNDVHSNAPNVKERRMFNPEEQSFGLSYEPRPEVADMVHYWARFYETPLD